MNKISENEKLKKMYAIIKNIIGTEALTFGDIQEIFQIGYEIFKKKRIIRNEKPETENK